jgi:hypothetical protein
MKRNIILFLIIGSMPVLAQRAHIGGYAVYYGDLHNHCNISDGKSSPANVYNAVKNTGKYDFFSLTDHAELMSPSEWSSMKRAANTYNEDGVFTAFWGFEWSSFIYGHVSVIGSDQYCSSFGLSTNTFTKLIGWANSCECIAFFNHPGLQSSLDLEFNHFNNSPSDRFVGMELFNENDGFSQYYYNDGYYSNDGGLSYFDEALTRGWRIGAAGADDYHGTEWGSNEFELALLGDDLTRSSIMTTLKARRFYPTLDKNIEISFKIHGHEMGSSLHSGSYNGEIRLHDADDEVFVKVDLLCNGFVIQTFAINEKSPVIPFTVNASNSDYYYIIIHQQDGDQAISSPVFIDDNYPADDLPVINIVNPFDGSVMPPGIINIEANAHDDDGTVKRAVFYINDVFVGADTSAPFSMMYNANSSGLYTITALAFDDKNAAAWSGPSTFTVSGETEISENTTYKPASIIIQCSNYKQYLLLPGIKRPESAVIVDLTGRVVTVLQINAEELTEIPADALRNGLYLIYIAGHPEIPTCKLFSK